MAESTADLSGSDGDRFHLICRDSGVVLEDLAGFWVDALRDAIGNYAQAQFLRSLEFDGSPYAMVFSIAVPAQLRVNRDSALITITNTSKEKLYYNILDIDGSNRVTVLIPGEKWLAGDLVLQPGQTIKYTIASFNTLGKEVLKLISTPTLLDLRGAVWNGRALPANSCGARLHDNRPRRLRVERQPDLRLPR